MKDYEIILVHDVYGTLVIPDKDEPIGWDNISFTMRRHDKYHGVFPEISTSLKWICSGYVFVSQCYDAYGIDAEIRIIIRAKVFDYSKWDEIYHGFLDLSTAKWTEEFVECEIKSFNCLDLFLNRTGTTVNLYDEPCYSELTFDKTAYRTRYAYAPYRVTLREQEIIGKTSFVLDKPVRCNIPDEYVKVGNGFSVEGGLGCTLTICFDPFAANPHPCGHTDTCENIAGDGPQVSSAGYYYHIINGVPLKPIVDDLKILEYPSEPQNGAEQYKRDCGNNIVSGETPWWNITGEGNQKRAEKQFYNGEAQCTCCSGDTIITDPCTGKTDTLEPPDCTGYHVKLKVSYDVGHCFDIVEGEVLYLRYQSNLVFEWGGFQIILDTSPVIDVTNGCAGFDNTCAGGCLLPACSGIGYLATDLTFEFDIPPCKVKALDKWFLITETQIGFIAGGVIGSNSDLSMSINTFWKEVEGEITSGDCIPDTLKVGDTRPNVYMVHESLSRVVEHYTNNCLRVKSDFFGRPNSMEWGDNCEIQNANCDDYGSGSAGGGCPVSILQYDATSPGLDLLVAACSIGHNPPGFPDAPCSGVDIQTFTANTTPQDDFGFFSANCFVVTTPGTYTVDYNLTFDFTGSVINWNNTENESAGVTTNININTGLSLQPVLLDILAIPPQVGTCHTGSIISPPGLQNYLGSFNVTYTALNIFNGDNMICIDGDLSTGASVVGSCNTNPAGVGVIGAIQLVIGTLTLTLANCVPVNNSSSGGPCDCNNPEPFPVCNEPFNIVPFQVNAAASNCYAYMVLTSGISLRQFGTQVNVTFNELFDSLNALFCLGVGYSELEPTILRVESWEYFYREEIILDLKGVDLYNAKWERKTLPEMYFNKFEFGYMNWLMDKPATAYEFNTKREYTLKIKNTENVLSRFSEYVGSGAAIEWTRRDIMNSNSAMDEDKFFICVGPSVNINNEAEITDGITTITLPSHMWEVEQGINYPSGYPAWKTVYNWRIAPVRCALLKWLDWLSMGMWFKPVGELVEFAKGEANFTVCGNQPGYLYPMNNCSFGYGCEDQSYPKNPSIRLFPEIVKFVFPLTVSQWNQIRLQPYGQIAFDNELYFIKQIDFKPNQNSTLHLIKAGRKHPTGP